MASGSAGGASSPSNLYKELLSEVFPLPDGRTGFAYAGTLDDQAVTVRDRDTMAQDRIPIANVEAYLAERARLGDVPEIAGVSAGGRF